MITYNNYNHVYYILDHEYPTSWLIQCTFQNITILKILSRSCDNIHILYNISRIYGKKLGCHV